jgi:diadenosine tetraphosphate (Ap4A) HIT family hydrolase
MVDETTPAERWDQWAKGRDCPFCLPRAASSEHWDFIAKLNVSSLYLTSNQAYRGHCFLVLDIRHAARPDQLSSEEWSAFCTDLYKAERALVQTVQPDHINIEMMGNIVPHLHWQIVPRYRADSRWGAPIWTTTVAEMLKTSLQSSERDELVQKLRAAVRLAIQPGVG